eukprot:539396_1
MANKIKTAAINSKTEPVGRRFRMQCDIKKLKPINTKAKILNEIIANEKNGNKNEKGILGVRSEKPMEISSANKRRKSNNSKSIPQNNSNSVGWE